ncbi:AraC-like ligand-binding domain-containing protein [Pseudonocardia adelaidensis]|uniref:Helix-turn-helix domain-containing protein n=1 Tax=Pseudonocardia adelaidensis TaxID=648754 RepID=A0ABP9NMM1_9PSEU
MDTATAASPLGFEDWRHQVCELVPLLAGPTETDAHFAGTLSSMTLGSVLLTTVSASRGFVERTPRLIRSDDVDVYKFGLQVGGTCIIEQDGHQALLAPGDLAIYDTSRPYRISFSNNFRMTVAIFPRSLVRIPKDDMATSMAVRLPRKSGIFPLIAPLLKELPREDRSDHLLPSTHVGDAIVSLTTAAFGQLMEKSFGEDPYDSHKLLLAQAIRFIKESLQDPQLSPKTVAAAHFVSVRHLQKVFEMQGTSVSATIRNLRLERCRSDLVAPRYRDVPIASIARRWGFNDPAHFSRLFRGTYGCSPREHRSSTLRPPTVGRSQGRSRTGS